MQTGNADSNDHLTELADKIKSWGSEFGFQQIAITDTQLASAAARLKEWLEHNYQGEMMWLAEHGDKRWRPDLLLPGTQRVIIGRMNYLPESSSVVQTLRDSDKAYISRYALGRDYHKLIRKRLAQLAKKIEEHSPGSISQRPFVDSAPVLEKPLAQKAGLGWMGKNSLILHPEAGSWFFLGEIYTSLPLPVDNLSQADQCGSCSACLTICPTKAFPKPYVLDASRCISYLTIELKGSIPHEFRPLIGNRVFGCDDCQLICPWNRFAATTGESDFQPRHQLTDSDLAALFRWTEEEFEQKTAGSPIRRIGYQRWLRNLAVGLGNAADKATAAAVLASRLKDASPLVYEHIQWALQHLDLEKRPQQRAFPKIETAGN